MVYLAFFDGIAVAAYCLVAAFFIVGAKPKSIVKEVLGFAGPIFCALFIGVLCNWSAKERYSELPFVSGATFCAGFSILLISLPRVIYRSAGGEPFQIAFLLRYSTYAAVVALIASAEALRPHLLQLSELSEATEVDRIEASTSTMILIKTCTNMKVIKTKSMEEEDASESETTVPRQTRTSQLQDRWNTPSDSTMC